MAAADVYQSSQQLTGVSSFRGTRPNPSDPWHPAAPKSALDSRIGTDSAAGIGEMLQCTAGAA
jgi:hypothetical protein